MSKNSENRTKPSINWEHVAPEYKWLARDADGDSDLFKNRPSIKDRSNTIGWWGDATACVAADASVFASFDPGTCHWKKSLVKRPEEEANG